MHICKTLGYLNQYNKGISLGVRKILPVISSGSRGISSVSPPFDPLSIVVNVSLGSTGNPKSAQTYIKAYGLAQSGHLSEALRYAKEAEVLFQRELYSGRVSNKDNGIAITRLRERLEATA